MVYTEVIAGVHDVRIKHRHALCRQNVKFCMLDLMVHKPLGFKGLNWPNGDKISVFLWKDRQ